MYTGNKTKLVLERGLRSPVRNLQQPTCLLLHTV